jgi:prepilin-type N-terminal cleavage/methylation domain-containing protein
MRPPRSSRRGLTLVELLAVAAILALSAGIAVGGLAAAGSHAELERAISDLKSLDRRARALARAQGPVVLAVDQNREALILLEPGSGARLGAACVPGEWRLWLEQAARGSDAVVVDRGGRSADYAVVVSGSWSVRYRVHGLTGLIEMETDSTGAAWSAGGAR